MEGNLPKFDYERYDPEDREQTESLEKVIEKCPKKRLLYVGTPTEKDLAAVADEEVPGTVQPDFKTTVDDTEWRGRPDDCESSGQSNREWTLDSRARKRAPEKHSRLSIAI